MCIRGWLNDKLTYACRLFIKNETNANWNNLLSVRWITRWWSRIPEFDKYSCASIFHRQSPLLAVAPGHKAVQTLISPDDGMLSACLDRNPGRPVNRGSPGSGNESGVDVSYSSVCDSDFHRSWCVLATANNKVSRSKCDTCRCTCKLIAAVKTRDGIGVFLFTKPKPWSSVVPRRPKPHNSDLAE